MQTQSYQKLFGTELRTRVLIAIAMMEETFPSELLRVLGGDKVYPVQRVVDAMEREGYLVTRKLGKERRININPRFFAYPELKELLLRLGSQDKELLKALKERRARPRRKGKPL